MDLEQTQKRLKEITSKYPDRKCKVYLLHGDLTEGQMTGLYTNPKVKAMINIAHGEGFGLPLYEAAREGHFLLLQFHGVAKKIFFIMMEKNISNQLNLQLKQIQKEAVWPGVLEANIWLGIC
jgi:hypothetical protein